MALSVVRNAREKEESQIEKLCDQISETCIITLSKTLRVALGSDDHVVKAARLHNIGEKMDRAVYEVSRVIPRDSKTNEGG